MRQKRQQHAGCPQWVLEKIRAIREQAIERQPYLPILKGDHHDIRAIS
jgi:hypothetical protein